MANKNNMYYVYNRNTGGAYISERTERTTTGAKYFWVKRKEQACGLTLNSARAVARRYGGVVRQF